MLLVIKVSRIYFYNFSLWRQQLDFFCTATAFLGEQEQLILLQATAGCGSNGGGFYKIAPAGIIYFWIHCN